MNFHRRFISVSEEEPDILETLEVSLAEDQKRTKMYSLYELLVVAAAEGLPAGLFRFFSVGYPAVPTKVSDPAMLTVGSAQLHSTQNFVCGYCGENDDACERLGHCLHHSHYACYSYHPHHYHCSS